MILKRRIPKNPPFFICVLKQILTIRRKIVKIELNNRKEGRFYSAKLAQMGQQAYICNVFFIVLDLRLTMKIGCRDDNHFFFKDVLC